jgi:hypothetical protein
VAVREEHELVALRAQGSGALLPQDGGDGQGPHPGNLAGDEGRHLLVLGPEEGAGGVEEPAARPEQPREAGAEVALRGREALGLVGAQAPARVGPAPERPEAAARGVDEDPVGDAGEVGQRGVGPGARGRRRKRRLWTPARRARRRASPSRFSSTSSAKRSPRFRISIASARAFPPAPAQASTTFCPGRAPVASAMSWLPSSWISNQPARKEGNAKALAWPPMTRPQGE